MPSREYPDRPIVGVGAVIIHDGRVVLARRARPPLAGQWSLPGGVVELGETLRRAVEREALEETGLTVQAEEVLEVLDRIIPGEGGRTQYHYVLVDFLCERLHGELQAGGDVAEVAWAREDELENYGLEALALAVIQKGFNHKGHSVAEPQPKPNIYHGDAEARRKAKPKAEPYHRGHGEKPRTQRKAEEWEGEENE